MPKTSENKQTLINPNDPVEDKNTNPSAYRVLYIMLLLVKEQSLNIDEINKKLLYHPKIARSYNTETMLKYINTLRRSGCEIPRVSKKREYRYQLKNNPIPLNLNEPELNTAIKVEKLLTEHPDKNLQHAYREFMNKIIWALPQSVSESIDRQKQKIEPEEPSRGRKRKNRLSVNAFIQYCVDEQVLEVTTISDLRLNTSTTRQIEPYEVIEEFETIHSNKSTPHTKEMEQQSQHYLMGYDTLIQKSVKLDLNKIVEVRQLPSKLKREQQTVHVIFQVYNRLAKTYRLYKGEEVMFRQEGATQILAKTTDPDKLLSRLMKYGTNCQILSPNSMRLAMKQRIQHLLDGIVLEQ